MATTSLWKFNRRLKGLIDYVTNNKKTNKKCSIWLDVVELWDYVNGGELHE